MTAARTTWCSRITFRIKIFTERGREKESKIDIPYLTGTKIKDVAARTIKPDGSIVELAKEDILEKTVVKVSGVRLRTKSFAFPGIEIGAIIEYKWKESSLQSVRQQPAASVPARDSRRVNDLPRQTLPIFDGLRHPGVQHEEARISEGKTRVPGRHC